MSTIKVKALEWTQYPDGGLQAIGAEMERFRVHPNGRSWYLGQDYMGEGGKDAAQAWFNAAILSVLEPSPDMREAVEARSLGEAIIDASDNADDTLAIDGRFLTIIPSDGFVRVNLHKLARALRSFTGAKP